MNQQYIYAMQPCMHPGSTVESQESRRSSTGFHPSRNQNLFLQQGDRTSPMKSAFEVCLKSGGIEKVPPDPEIYKQERVNAEESLTRAIGYEEENDPRRAILEGYYAVMFALRAPLLKMGYRPKTGSCLRHAVQELLINTGKLERDLMIGFDMAQEIRGVLDEHFTGPFYHHQDAQQLVRFADHVLQATKSLM